MSPETTDTSPRVVAEFASARVRTRITEDADGGYLWHRGAGTGDLPPPRPARTELLAAVPERTGAHAADLLMGRPYREGVAYRVEHHRTLAALFEEAVPDGGPELAHRFRALGAALSVLHTSPVPPALAADGGEPAALTRLRAWAAPEGADTGTGPALRRLRTACSRRLGSDRWRRLVAWCDAMSARAPGSARGLVHGAPSLGTAVAPRSPVPPVQLLTGEAVAIAPPEFDVGWVLGELVELASLPAPADPRVREHRADLGARCGSALLDGYRSELDPGLLDRMKTLRILLHMRDFAEAVGWTDQFGEYMDKVSELVDTVGGGGEPGDDTTGTRSPAGVYRVAPAPVPEEGAVNAFLESLGLGRLGAGEVSSFTGRNDNWSGTTTSGTRVFVKQIAPAPGGRNPAFRRSVAFERLVAAEGVRPLAPRCLGWDDEHGLLVWEELAGAVSGAESADDDRFTEDDARGIGQVLADLHGLVPATGSGLEDTPPDLPDLDMLDAIPVDLYLSSSMAQIQAWQILQDDAELGRALRRLRERERAAPTAPTHCDIRLDQFLTVDGRLYLTDWEEFRLADPARDVGAYTGEWLYRSMVGRPSDDADHGTFGARAAARFDEVRGYVTAMWDRYRQLRRPDPDFTERAAAWAGWHLFERLIAGSRERARLGAVVRAAAGVGRRALIDPAAAAGLLGLTGPGIPAGKE